MKKISIKREQSQAGLSFAERENRRSAAGGKAKFRPQVKNKLLLLLALLMTAATGAWAQDAKHLITATYREQTRSLEQPLPYATTIGEFYEAVTGQSFSGLISSMSAVEMPLTGISSNNTSVVIGELNGASTPVTVNADGKATISINFGSYAHGIFVSVTSPLYAYMKDGVKDADKWTVKVGEGQAQALPIGGLKGDGKETVTLQYNGRLKVKGVKATSDEKPAAPSVAEVTTFSELQAALSAGKNVKLMSDIECTAEISITSGALTIDGNGKTLSTTSAIRAFKVGSSATVAFKNLTFTGFVNGGGPAINNSGTIVLDGCTISNCHVNNTNGGGAIENKGKLYAINTTFSNNYSGEIGGAINNYTGSLYMSGCTFTNNYTTKPNAYYGGAIGINMGSEVRLINCAFAANKYGTDTGYSDIGVYNNPTNYTIAGCTGATIASRNGDKITTIASGTATLDYSDLSNIAFTVEQAAKPAATVTTAPTGAAVVGVGKTTALVSGGAADGGTLMYAVTTTNTKPASTDGFSGTVPTAKDITASGTVYVWYYVKADDTHSDSEIAATAIEVPVADIVWDASNVTDIDVAGIESYEKEGVRLSANAAEIYAYWVNSAAPELVGIIFEVYESGGFTFTAPTGKAFTKIVMTPNGPAGWNETNLGTGWAFNNPTVTWTGSAASTVDLLTDDIFAGDNVTSIGFYLVDAE